MKRITLPVFFTVCLWFSIPVYASPYYLFPEPEPVLSISVQPQSQEICEGTQAYFFVEAESDKTLSYQWYKNDEPISGAISDTYTPVATYSDHESRYYVVITEEEGESMQSETAVLTVQKIPVVLSQPVAGGFCGEGTAALEVTAENAGGYQWQFNASSNSGPFSDLAGATLSSYSTQVAGYYRVKITGAGVCAIVDDATVYSNSAPIEAYQPVVIDVPLPASSSACEGTPLTFTITASGTITAYRWFKNDVLIPGEQSNTLEVTAEEDGTVYRVEVEGPCGTLSGSTVLQVYLTPVITSQPVDTEACAGEDATLTVAVAQSNLYDFQWYRWEGATPISIPGATGSSLTLPDVTEDDAMSYFVDIWHKECPTHNVASHTVSLTVHTPIDLAMQPELMPVCEGGQASLYVVATGSITGYRWYKDGAVIITTSENEYAFPVALADNDATLQVEVLGPCGNVMSDLLTLSVQPRPIITVQPTDAEICQGETHTFTPAALNAGSYEWTFNSGSGDDEYFPSAEGSLNATQAGSYTLSAYGAGLACSDERAVSHTVTLTVHTPVSITAPPELMPACEGGHATLYLAAAGSVTGYRWYKNGVVVATTSENEYGFPVTLADNGATVQVEVLGPCGNVMSEPLNLSVSPQPVITVQPASASICLGETHTFTPQVLHAESYEWTFNSGSGEDQYFPSADGSLNATQAGSYTLTAYGAGLACSDETVSSNTVTLTVNVPVAITAQPEVTPVCEAGQVNLAVEASGTIIGYRWYKNDILIEGAVSSEYSFPVTLADNGATLQVEVLGPCGNVMSEPVTLTVDPKPVFTVQPTSAEICQGQTHTFTPQVLHAESYEWTFNSGSGEDQYFPSADGSLNATQSGSYTLTAYGAGLACSDETVSSNTVTLTVNVPLSITAQPQSTTVCAGSTAHLQITASGTITQYRWYRNNVLIEGVNSPEFSFTATAGDNDAVFTVEVQGPCNTVTSTEAVVTVNIPANIVAQPVPQSVCAGQTASFSVTAGGDITAYQWYKNNQPLEGATSATYSFTASEADHQAVFRVEITGPCGSISSQEAALTVNVPVAISTQPEAMPVCEAGQVNLSVVASGTITGYRWYKNDILIDGATLSEYSFPVTLTDNGGTVQVEVLGPCGNVMSDLLTLTVDPKPVITVQPTSAEICQGETHTFTPQVLHADSYEWTFNSGSGEDQYFPSADGSLNATQAGSYTLTAYGSGLACSDERAVSNTVTLTVNVPVAITAQPQSSTVCASSTAQLQITATGTITQYRWYRNNVLIDGANSPDYSFTATADDNGALFTVEVEGPCSTLTSTEAVVTVNIPATITTQPVAQSVCAGQTASFSVTAGGDITTYQWYKNNQPLEGATSATYSFTATEADHLSVFRVEITGPCGNISSQEAALTVNVPLAITAQPESSTVCAGSTTQLQITATGTITQYRWYRNNVLIDGANSPEFSFTATAGDNDAVFTVEVQGPCNTLTSTEAVVTVNIPASITMQPVAQSVCAGQPASFSVTVGGDINSYQWYRNNQPVEGATAATYSFTAIEADHQAVFRVEITGPCGSISSQEVALTVNVPLAITAQPEAMPVCEAGQVNLAVAATGTVTGYRWYKNNVLIDGTTSSEYSFPVTLTDNGATVQVEVLGPCGNVMSEPVTLSVTPKPVITVQPTSAEICQGETHTFTPQVLHAESYEWTFNSGSGEDQYFPSTDGSLNATQGGSYTLTAYGAGLACSDETVSSNTVTLTVNVPLTITAQPQSSTVCAGSTAQLQINATGTITQYRWYRNNVLIEAANANTYSFTATAQDNDAVYTVEVEGPCNTLTSSAAVITVMQATVPELVSSKPLGICAGDSTTLTATGCTSAVSWYLNNTYLSDGNTLITATPGTYRAKCEEEGCVGEVFSEPLVVALLSEPAFDLNLKNVTCYDGSDGQAKVTLSEPGTIQWLTPFSGTHFEVEGLKAGEYTFELTNAGGCKTLHTFTILQPVVPQPSLETEDVSCFGQQDGKIILGAESDNGGLTYFLNAAPYAWGDPAAYSLSAGYYTVRIQDGKGCEILADTVVQILEPPVLSAVLLGATAPLGFTSEDGSIEMLISGGTPPYQVNWSRNGSHLSSVQNTPTPSGTHTLASGLSGGAYTLSVIDSKGCTFSTEILLSAPQPLALTSEIKAVSCFGEADGEIALLISGGIPATGGMPYTTTWKSDGQILAQDSLHLSGLPAGLYEITVTDAHAVSATFTVTLTQPERLAAVVGEISGDYCDSAPKGELILDITGGTGAYTLLYNDSLIHGNRISGMEVGQYDIVISDEAQCLTRLTADIPRSTSSLEINLTYLPPSCYGKCDGEISAAVKGGFSPYTYDWGVPSPGDATLLNVCGQDTTVLYLTDAKGCTMASTPLVQTRPAPRILDLPTEIVVCPSDTFTLDASALAWGETFNWTTPNGLTLSGPAIGGTQLGAYTVTVLDENSCGGIAEIFAVQDSSILVQFALPSEVPVQKEFVLVDLTFPFPEDIEWDIPEQGQILSSGEYEMRMSFSATGTYPITQRVRINGCTYSLTKTIEIKEALDDDGFPAPFSGTPLDFAILGNPATGNTVNLRIARDPNEVLRVRLISADGLSIPYEQVIPAGSESVLHWPVPLEGNDPVYIITVENGLQTVSKKLALIR